jgi:hypothetical protein
MAKRITQDRVKRFAESNKALIGTPLVIGLFVLIVFLGAGEVTGYSANEVCAGTEADPCWLILNMTFTEDVFIYPFNNTALVLGTDKPLKELRLYRSWGFGWREIKLDQTCRGTWCGGTGYVNKYSFAFREGKSYTLKFVALKDHPFQTIHWSFNPSGVWKGVEYNLNASNCIMKNVTVTEDIRECPVVGRYYHIRLQSGELVESYNDSYASSLTNATFLVNRTNTDCFTVGTQEVTKLKCIKEKGVFVNGVDITPDGYVCSKRGVDSLECDYIGDSNGDGKCSTNGGETCLIRRFINSTSYVESQTNSELPDYATETATLKEENA